MYFFISLFSRTFSDVCKDSQIILIHITNVILKIPLSAMLQKNMQIYMSPLC